LLDDAGNRDDAIFDQLMATTAGSPEHTDLLNGLMGPSWQDVFGTAALNDEYQVWNQAFFEAGSR